MNPENNMLLCERVLIESLDMNKFSDGSFGEVEGIRYPFTLNYGWPLLAPLPTKYLITTQYLGFRF